MRTAKVDFVIRDFRDGDVEGALVMERLTHQFPWDRTDFQTVERLDGLLLCALLPGDYGDEFVGHIAVSQMGESCCVHRLAVHPEWQRCGIGTGLYYVAAKTVGPVKNMLSDVPPGSFAHRKFWESLGFVPTPRPKVDGAALIFRRK